MRHALGVMLILGCNSGSPTRPPATDYVRPTPWAPATTDLARHVDTRAGTAGSGNTIPGAMVPHGFVRPTPHTDNDGTLDGYEYNTTRIEGFTHTHLEGPGGSGYGYSQIRVMPDVGPRDLEDLSSAYSHDRETAEPGYYAVDLDDTGVRAEMTASAHAAIHRYTFPASEESRVVLDWGFSNGRSIGGAIEVVGRNVVQGFAEYDIHPAISLILRRDATRTAIDRIYVYAELSKPAQRWGTFADDEIFEDVRLQEGPDLGSWLGFSTEANEIVELRIGLSLIGVDEARNNLWREIGDATFEAIRDRARGEWNGLLNRVDIDGDDALKQTFYRALYHAVMQPTDVTESDGRQAITTATDRVIRSESRRHFTDDWCMWDTFRTSHPLGTIVEPEIRGEIVQSMLAAYEVGGWLPTCTWHASGYSRVMTGNHGVPIIVDAWAKGLRGFDLDLAFEAMNKAATEEVPELSNPYGLCGYFGLGTPPEYISLGYVPHECDTSQAASMTLEHAYDDWALARFAEGTGRATDAVTYDERGEYWRSHWNPDIGFMQPRMADGSWLEPYDPADGRDFNGWVEATGWIFTFFVPHDVPGLISAIGGDETFVAKLDQFFAEGRYDATNQPSFHIPWLYNYAGAAHKTQKLVRELLREHFGPGPDGLPGNDDAGSTSAWYVLGALGIYPVAPGEPIYQIGAPLVDRAVIHLHPDHYTGGTFVIEVENQAPDNDYIQSVTLNGAPLERSWIAHDEIAGGGTLHFVLGPEPSAWPAL